jgi:hypothetical protein
MCAHINPLPSQESLGSGLWCRGRDGKEAHGGDGPNSGRLARVSKESLKRPCAWVEMRWKGCRRQGLRVMWLNSEDEGAKRLAISHQSRRPSGTSFDRTIRRSKLKLRREIITIESTEMVALLTTTTSDPLDELGSSPKATSACHGTQNFLGCSYGSFPQRISPATFGNLIFLGNEHGLL